MKGSEFTHTHILPLIQPIVAQAVVLVLFYIFLVSYPSYYQAALFGAEVRVCHVSVVTGSCGQRCEL